MFYTPVRLLFSFLKNFARQLHLSTTPPSFPSLSSHLWASRALSLPRFYPLAKVATLVVVSLPTRPTVLLVSFCLPSHFDTQVYKSKTYSSTHHGVNIPQLLFHAQPGHLRHATPVTSNSSTMCVPSISQLHDLPCQLTRLRDKLFWTFFFKAIVSCIACSAKKK